MTIKKLPPIVKIIGLTEGPHSWKGSVLLVEVPNHPRLGRRFAVLSESVGPFAEKVQEWFRPSAVTALVEACEVVGHHPQVEITLNASHLSCEEELTLFGCE
ncbi:MAG: hypothetical protein ACOCRX_02340 [Candidatus Woesearchaeota archaeon]